MTWASILLADPSPCLRRLVLLELLRSPNDDPEVQELAELRNSDPMVGELVALQGQGGYWQTLGDAGSTRAGEMRATAQAMLRLGYVGLGPEHAAVSRGAEALFALQSADGSWPLHGAQDEDAEQEGYSMVPLQTALPLRALASCGYATDARSEVAYDWLIGQRLPDGTWPTGIAAGSYGRVAGYRRLAHSGHGCRTSTTAALACLALHPSRRHSPEAQRALDLLLGRETRERHALGFEVARVIGAEPSRGTFTYHARFDLGLILDLSARVGATTNDARLAEVVSVIEGWQGQYGLWEYMPRPQATRWVSFDILRSLSRLDAGGDWVSREPRTPFRPYSRRERRF